MSHTEEYQRLARRFVDAWQEQMASLSNDGEFIRALLELMQAPEFPPSQSTSDAPTDASKPPRGYAATSGARDIALARIESSLKSIEKRLSRLERAAKSPANAAAKDRAASYRQGEKPGRNVSKPRGKPHPRQGG